MSLFGDKLYELRTSTGRNVGSYKSKQKAIDAARRKQMANFQVVLGNETIYAEDWSSR